MSFAPGKIIAVHLNYASRAAERGKSPTAPSYFLKSPSTVTVDGAQVERPHGCELLAFEGELAVVVRDVPHNVSIDEAWNYVEGVTAGNDFGVYDLRHADPGSNLHSKGFRGFTPLGPDLMKSEDISSKDLRVRTWVDGQLVQDADDTDLIFSVEYVVADLARVIDLNAGDVILMGTATGSSVVEPGSLVEVEVTAGEGHSSGRLSNRIVQSEVPLPAVGAMPKVDDTTRDAAYSAPITAR
ncbi:MAG TPA: fumarylacetoacetate hydrolase family protein [Pseudolysinimonas sp.]|nr:fumarylacetoacetate hydrolase family protein [Pseudolysinimonas sp.]